jgi:hypothetical protein
VHYATSQPASARKQATSWQKPDRSHLTKRETRTKVRGTPQPVRIARLLTERSCTNVPGCEVDASSASTPSSLKARQPCRFQQRYHLTYACH